MIDMLLRSAFGGIQSLAGSVFHTIGWGGVTAILAGVVLVLSLSGRAIKLLASPRGMGVTAAVMVAGLLAMWWAWPKPDPSPRQSLVSAAPEKPKSEPSRGEPEPPPVLASETEEEEPASEEVVSAEPIPGQVPVIEGVVVAGTTPFIPPLPVVKPSPPPRLVLARPSAPATHAKPHPSPKPTPVVTRSAAPRGNPPRGTVTHTAPPPTRSGPSPVTPPSNPHLSQRFGGPGEGAPEAAPPPPANTHRRLSRAEAADRLLSIPMPSFDHFGGGFPGHPGGHMNGMGVHPGMGGHMGGMGGHPGMGYGGAHHR